MVEWQGQREWIAVAVDEGAGKCKNKTNYALTGFIKTAALKCASVQAFVWRMTGSEPISGEAIKNEQ